jgi:hypothetical protein
MEDQSWWPYGEAPVAGTVEGAPLSPRQIAELLKYGDLLNKYEEQLLAEGRESGQGMTWRVEVKSDFSHMSAERRAEVEGKLPTSGLTQRSALPCGDDWKKNRSLSC